MDDDAESTEIDYSQVATWESVAGFLNSEVTATSSNNCGIWECWPGWRWRLTLVDFDLWYVTKGRGRVAVTNFGLEYEVGPGTMLVLRPGDAVAADQDIADPLTVVAVHIHFVSRVDSEVVEVPHRLLPFRYVPVRDAASLETSMTKLVLLDSRRDPLSRVESSLLIQQVLIRLYRQDAENRGQLDHQGTVRFDRLIAHIDQMPQTWVPLGEAARFVGLSADYFSRQFAREFGVGYRTYCLQRRLDQANRLIHETDLTVGEVAEALGYADVSLLSRQFKARFGFSPKQSRRITTG